MCTTPDHPECCFGLPVRTSPCPGVPFSRTTMLECISYLLVMCSNIFVLHPSSVIVYMHLSYTATGQVLHSWMVPGVL